MPQRKGKAKSLKAEEKILLNAFKHGKTLSMQETLHDPLRQEYRISEGGQQKCLERKTGNKL